mgnify:CR=1 FL=1
MEGYEEVNSMWKLYSWKDVERMFLINKYMWKKIIYDIEVYPSEINVIFYAGKKEDADDIIKKIFGINYIRESILMDSDGSIPVYFQEMEDERCKRQIPLFKYNLYSESSYASNLLKQPFQDAPVIAFHSYKGGVGRTLSLLAFVKAWSELAGNQKLLIVDSDIEAPGLTWMLPKNQEKVYSYLDLLECIQEESTADEVVEKVADMVSKTTIKIETSKQTVEHFILPTYRYIEQSIDLYTTPAVIADGYKKEYMIGEVLSKLGQKLNTAAVLIDLRAGISEFSAPVVFDPRIKKYLVTSTSFQSVKGCEILMELMNKGLPIQEQTLLPEILISMVTEDSDTSEIATNLLEKYCVGDENASMTDNLITVLPFASELIHLDSLKSIMLRLNERDFYKKIKDLVFDNYIMKDSDVNEDTNLQNDRSDFIRNINMMATNQITAERNETFKVLLTEPIQNLIQRIQISIPNVVVLGAKGSGKTFLYKELINCKFLEYFTTRANTDVKNQKTVIIPFLANKNFSEMQTILESSVKTAGEFLESSINLSLWFDNANDIAEFKEVNHTEKEWTEYWKKQLCKSLGDENCSLEEWNQKCYERDKKVVLVIDGLEEIFKNTSNAKNEKLAIATLCQDIINEVRLKYKNIGFIIFMRTDIMRNVISVNFDQFISTYEDIQLNWTHKEALRLAVWLVDQANPGFYKDDVPIEKASPEIVESNLLRLWGKKLGKSTSNEAYTSRWILGALSDFNGQLQARDMIRFLKYATVSEGRKYYKDRYIEPSEIKNAVPGCSVDKIKDIEIEIESMKPIFEKLRNADSSVKKLPFTSDIFGLTADEEKMMIQEGYLKIDKNRYYMPEIIRYALGFQYGKGARPKVLSLMAIGMK